MHIQKRSSRKTTAQAPKIKPRKRFGKHSWSGPQPCSFAVALVECKKCHMKYSMDYRTDHPPAYGCSSYDKGVDGSTTLRHKVRFPKKWKGIRSEGSP